jgi:hypothetical protein
MGTVPNIADEHAWGFRGASLVKITEDFNLSALVYVQNQHFNGFEDITGGAIYPNNALAQNSISNGAEPH